MKKCLHTIVLSPFAFPPIASICLSSLPPFSLSHLSHSHLLPPLLSASLSALIAPSHCPAPLPWPPARLTDKLDP